MCVCVCYGVCVCAMVCGGSAQTSLSMHALIPTQVKKFMVGYEMLAQAQRDLTAEQVHTRVYRHICTAHTQVYCGPLYTVQHTHVV